MSLKIICTRDLEQYRRRKHNSTSINRSKRLNSACTWGTNYWPKGPLTSVPAKGGGQWPLQEVSRIPSSAELITLQRLVSSRRVALFGEATMAVAHDSHGVNCLNWPCEPIIFGSNSKSYCERWKQTISREPTMLWKWWWWRSTQRTSGDFSFDYVNDMSYHII